MIDPEEVPAQLVTFLRAARQRADRVHGTVADTGVAAGQVEGLLERQPARLRPLPDENTYHHAGYLAGNLLRWTAQRGRAPEGGLVVDALVYGAALADTAGQRNLVHPRDTVDRAHLYAMVRVEKKRGAPLPAADETLFLSWLLTQLRLRLAQGSPEAFARRRRTRIERLFPGTDA